MTLVRFEDSALAHLEVPQDPGFAIAWSRAVSGLSGWTRRSVVHRRWVPGMVVGNWRLLSYVDRAEGLNPALVFRALCLKCGVTVRCIAPSSALQRPNSGCLPCHLKNLERGRKPKLCRSCGTKDVERFRANLVSECEACNRAAMRNGRCACGKAVRKTKPCAVCRAPREHLPPITSESRARAKEEAVRDRAALLGQTPPPGKTCGSLGPLGIICELEAGHLEAQGSTGMCFGKYRGPGFPDDPVPARAEVSKA